MAEDLWIYPVHISLLTPSACYQQCPVPFDTFGIASEREHRLECWLAGWKMLFRIRNVLCLPSGIARRSASFIAARVSTLRA